MASLKATIVALRQEINASLRDDVSANHSIRLEPAEIILSLQLSVQETAKPDGSAEVRFEVQDNATQPVKSVALGTPHTLTIKFNAVSAQPHNGDTHLSSVSIEDQSVKSEMLPMADHPDNPLIQTLSTVLGTPGFDSSARATVFREALDGLTDAQALSTMHSLIDPGLLKDDDFVKHAHHLIGGVLKSGPLKSASEGGKTLTQVFASHSTAGILNLVEKVWKTQADWLT